MKPEKPQNDILPSRAGETDEERRLREAINRHCAPLMATLDAAIRFRTAPNEAQRARHMARGRLVEFALMAMHSQALTEAE